MKKLILVLVFIGAFGCASEKDGSRVDADSSIIPGPPVYDNLFGGYQCGHIKDCFIQCQISYQHCDRDTQTDADYAACKTQKNSCLLGFPQGHP